MLRAGSNLDLFGTLPQKPLQRYRSSHFQDRYTFASEVWSYGVVLWEILHDGALPWEDEAPAEVIVHLLGGDTPPLQESTDAITKLARFALT